MSAGDSEMIGKIRYGGPMLHRLEQHQLPAGAEQPDGQAERDRASIAQQRLPAPRSTKTAGGIIVSDQTT